jgi:replicative DNA helicase
LNIHQRDTPNETIASGSPPHNIEAEQALLGAILINNHAYGQVESIIAAEHFFEPINGQILEVCASLIGKGKLATPITVKTFLPANLDIAGMKLSQYLARLAAEATTVINAPDYARTVRDLATRRRLLRVTDAGSEILRNAPPDMAPEELFAHIIAGGDEILAGQLPLALHGIDFGEGIDQRLAEMSDAIKRGQTLAGVTYGLRDLDRRTGGIKPGNYIIIAARPGMGKTALALHCALRAAEQGSHVVYFSLEMSAQELFDRALTGLAYKISGKLIPYFDLRSQPHAASAYFEDLRNARDAFNKLPLRIEPDPELNMAQIEMRARRRQQQVGLDLIIIDHLGLVGSTGRYSNNPTAEMEDKSKACKRLAKRLNVPVLGLCQLSRKPEERDDKRPLLSDLRQSGSLEQDADVVLFPFREAYYLSQREPKLGEDHLRWQATLDACSNNLEICIAKQRQGETRTIKAFCIIESNFISDLASGTLDSDRLRTEAA